MIWNRRYMCRGSTPAPAHIKCGHLIQHHNDYLKCVTSTMIIKIGLYTDVLCEILTTVGSVN